LGVRGGKELIENLLTITFEYVTRLVIAAFDWDAVFQTIFSVLVINILQMGYRRLSVLKGAYKCSKLQMLHKLLRK
jgi:hypothetical protein